MKTGMNSGDLDGQAVPAPLVTPFVLLLLNHTRGKNQKVLTTSEIYPWSFVTQKFRNGLKSSHSGDRKSFDVTRIELSTCI